MLQRKLNQTIAAGVRNTVPDRSRARRMIRQRQTQQKELAKVQRSIDRCLDFIINGDGAMDTVRQKLSDLEHSKANILRLMDQDTSPAKVEPHPNIGQLYQRRVEQLSHLLNDDSSQQEAVTIIRSLIDRIEIAPGEKRVIRKCNLLVTFRRSLNWRYQGNKKPPSKKIAVCVLFKVLIDVKGLVARKLINGI